MVSSSRHTLRINFIALSIVQGTNFLLPLLVMPYVISRIGAAGFGVIAVAQACMVWLSAVTDYGFNLTATREAAIFGQDHAKMSVIFFTVLATRLLLCTFLFILMLIVFALIPDIQHYFMLYCLGFSYVLGQSLFASWFFQGMQRMQYITIGTFIARLVFVILVFLFIQQKSDGVYFLLFLGLGNIIAGVFSIVLALRLFGLSFIRPKRKAIAYEIKNGWQITLSNLSVYTCLYSGIFILRIFTNDTMVGYYSIAERIFFAVRQVLAVFAQVVYPRICQLSLAGAAATAQFFKTVYRPFLFLVFGGCCLLYLLCHVLIQFFLKDGHPLPVLLLRMLSFVPLIVCLNIPAYNLLLAFERKKSYLMVLGAATIINIVANLVLAGKFGPSGTVLSIIITEIFITAGLYRQLYKNHLSGYLMPGS